MPPSLSKPISTEPYTSYFYFRLTRSQTLDALNRRIAELGALSDGKLASGEQEEARSELKGFLKAEKPIASLPDLAPTSASTSSSSPSAPPPPPPSTSASRPPSKRSRKLNDAERREAQQTDRKVRHSTKIAAGGVKVEVGGELRTTGPGWRGKNLRKEERVALKGCLKGLELVMIRYDPSNTSPTLLLDDRRLMVFRSGFMSADWISLVDRVVAKGEVAAAKGGMDKADKTRGSHRNGTIGAFRAYRSGMQLTATQTKGKNFWVDFRDDPDTQRLCTWVTSVLRIYNPTIVRRYEETAEAGEEFKPRFGMFHQLCLNLAVNSSVCCHAHVDFKNLAIGYCVIIVYGHFDHTTRYHLCIPDLGVVMEFAAGTFIALPSALLEHHNIHSDQFEVYATQGGSEFREKRGTLVLFTQGNVMMSAEKGMTAAEGKREGVDMKCEYGLDAFNCAVFD